MHTLVVLFGLMAVFSGVYSATIPENVYQVVEEINEDVEAFEIGMSVPEPVAGIQQPEVSDTTGPGTVQPRLLGVPIKLISPILGKLFG
ncbi:hypothetical protein DMENIID0001_056350 [Sergentomyia squamirostris]